MTEEVVLLVAFFSECLIILKRNLSLMIRLEVGTNCSCDSG